MNVSTAERLRELLLYDPTTREFSWKCRRQGRRSDKRPGDNRFCNLRLASRSENMWNRGMSRNNTSGSKGVYWNKPTRKWQAQIMKNGRSINLGFFATLESAHAVYTATAKVHHGAFARVA